MECSVDRAAVLNAVRTLKHVVPTKSVIPVHTHTLISANSDLELRATDGDMSAVCHVPCKTTKAGRAMVPVVDLAKVLAKGPPAVTIRSHNGVLDVATPQSTVSLPILNPKTDCFPTLVTLPAGGVTLPAKAVREMLGFIAHARSKDETRLNLAGVYLELHPRKAKKTGAKGAAGREGLVHDLRLTATDGHRLATIERPVTCAAAIASTILPARIVAELMGLLKVDVGTWPGITPRPPAPPPSVTKVPEDVGVQRPGWVHVTYGETLVSHRKIEGEFPDWCQVVPSATKFNHMLVFSQPVMKTALEAAMNAHARCSHTKGVALRLKAGKLRITAECPDGGKADIAVATSACEGTLAVGFNARYLLDAVDVLPGAGGFYFTDEVSPMLCRCPSESGFMAVVMPFRL